MSRVATFEAQLQFQNPLIARWKADTRRYDVWSYYNLCLHGIICYCGLETYNIDVWSYYRLCRRYQIRDIVDPDEELFNDLLPTTTSISYNIQFF